MRKETITERKLWEEKDFKITKNPVIVLYLFSTAGFVLCTLVE